MKRILPWVFCLLSACLPPAWLPLSACGADGGERIPIVLHVEFGVRVRMQTEREAGSHGLPGHGCLLITEVQAGSPADQAGILPGDSLLMANGLAMSSPLDLLRFLSQQPPHSVAYAVLLRKGKHIICPVALKILPEPKVVGYLRPTAHPLEILEESLLSAQRELAATLSGAAPDFQAARRVADKIRRLASLPAHSPIRLWFQDGQGFVTVTCKANAISVSTENGSENLRSSRDALSAPLRARLQKIGAEE